MLEDHFGQVVGLDYSEEMLRYNPCQNKFIGSSISLPFADKSFDIVVASHLLHHIEESDRLPTLVEMARVARAAVISFEPNRDNPLMFLLALLSKEERMALKFNKRYIRSLFKSSGLNLKSIHVENWIVPNKAPHWWIPIGRAINQSPLRRIGFDICAVCTLDNNAIL